MSEVLTFDEDIGGGDVERAVSGAVAAVRSRVPGAQPCDRQPAAGRAKMMSGITLLHLHSAGRERPMGVRQCPVQLAVAADRRNGAAVYEEAALLSNKHAGGSEAFISAVFELPAFSS